MRVVVVTKEEQSIITNFMRLEVKIATILAKMSNLERLGNKASTRYQELLNELKTALVSEKNSVEVIKKRSGCCSLLMISFLEAQKLLNMDEGIVILNFSMIEYILFRVNQLLFAAMAEDTPINHDTEILFNIDKLIYANFLSSNNNPKLKYKLAFANHAFCEDFVQANFNPGLLCPGMETEFLKDEPQYEEKKNAYLVKRVVRLVCFAAANNLKDLDTYLDLILEVKKLMPQELFDSFMYKLVNSGIPEQKLNEIYAALERKEKEQNQRKHLD